MVRSLLVALAVPSLLLFLAAGVVSRAPGGPAGEGEPIVTVPPLPVPLVAALL